MEDDKLIQYKNPKKMVDLTKIDQIQEYVINKEKEKYVIQFAIIKDEMSSLAQADGNLKKPPLDLKN